LLSYHAAKLIDQTLSHFKITAKVRAWRLRFGLDLASSIAAEVSADRRLTYCLALEGDNRKQ
jgi:hypothetical protein